ncbi:MAG: DUF488 family protein [Candidatus Acididesulfobacter diazotrophicus]|uniref:DUF488 family protein n=1 Tax=Candidatus Acididesulfobacter diazotrophicus TaxID=2597226 RepID=A0A519BKE2_9DELT|nr:MAG: DUF488 family protein [Candidatus Acididesulfobacter diazotrophicus]
MNMINIRRVYEEPSDEDGIRILIDRLWPRGISKEKAKINFWFKDIAPSNDLRKLYHTAAIDFNEFKKRYLIELSGYKYSHNATNEDESDNSLAQISAFVKNGGKNITLLYGLKDEINNNATVLKDFILKAS